MTKLPHFEELADLVWALINDQLDADGTRRLQQLLNEDREYLRAYLKLLDQFAALEWERSEGRPSKADLSLLVTSGQDDATPPVPTIILDLAPPMQPSSKLFAPGSMFFCYGVSAAIVAVGLLIAWSSTIPLLPTVAQKAPPPAAAKITEPEIQFVGRITGVVECKLVASTASPVEGAHVALGQQYTLESGLLEITYDTGAKVLLQAPCRYDVESSQSGFLAVGKLTARVNGKTELSQRAVAKKTHLPELQSLIPDPSALFVVRTPTSIVTDLGTEFGVEVDESGASVAHVFQGKIEVRPVRREGQKIDRAVTLQENESARVESKQSSAVAIVRQVALADRFTRQMPKRIRLKLSNTGVGVKEGENDLHWQVVARTDDAHFAPRPAVVAAIPVHRYPQDAPGVGRLHMLPNNPSESQWVALTHNADQPENTTFTFRTSFELANVQLNTAVLRGRFIVDDHVSAIRLNGQSLPVPAHEWTWMFFTWSNFQATSGFVEGTNVLEIDVYNGKEAGSTRNDHSGLSLRVELEGTAVPRWRPPAAVSDSTTIKKQ